MYLLFAVYHRYLTVCLRHNGVSIPLEIVGIDELPPVSLRVVTNGTQVGIQGATYLVSKFFDIKRLGASGSTATFSWEADDKVYVCHEPWSQDRVRDLLIEATTRQMPGINVAVTCSP